MDILNVLWDVDGTLFDTYPAITYAISKSLNEMGITIALNVIDGLARQSVDHCIVTLSQRFKLDLNLLRDRFAESYRSIDPANQLPFPGVHEVCERIHQNGGLNIAITHRNIQSTQGLLNAHELAQFFVDIFSVEQGYPHKPDPTMLLAALKKHTLNPVETLLIGDRSYDIQAGQAAGVRTLLFGEVELSNPADFQIDDYAQLLSRLKGSSS